MHDMMNTASINPINTMLDLMCRRSDRNIRVNIGAPQNINAS